MSVLKAVSLARVFPGYPPVTALKNASLDVAAGEKFAIYGASGAGKSTLLNLLGLLDTPSSGSYQLLGEETATLTHRQRDELRALRLGFIFQQFQVLGHRSTWANIDLKLTILDVPIANRRTMITKVLDEVRLSHRMGSLARTLSGGEKQRLAIARAIVHEPSVILADEPTGNLDAKNTTMVLDLLDRAAARGIAVVVITHDEALSEWADRVVYLEDGVLEETRGEPLGERGAPSSA